MEGVPRMPMLSFDLKTCSELIEFTPALKSYISEAYHENPDSYGKECAELDQLRQTAVQVTVDFVGCSVLKKYYAQLHFLQSRFPMKNGDAVVIPFTWEDAYARHPYTVTDITFEMACVLYNIGCLHSILGCMDSRTSAEGMKVSCTHFQCAAWAFQHLRDTFDSNASPDMSHNLLSFMYHLMLAQAQECILEKSMTDNRKSSITAKVSAQIVEYYKLAIKSLDASNSSSLVGSKKVKEWKKRMELKINFYDCLTLYYLGTCAEEQQKWGERITYFQAALDKLNECTRLYGKGDGDSAAIGESLRFALDVSTGKCTSAKKDNDFIYHEKVPALDSLPEVKGASLVKGIPFNHADPEVSGLDIFRKLVPIEAHKASSLYSEEKAKLLRRVTGSIEETNQELSQFMSSLQLESVTQIVPEPQRLPQALIEKCAALSVRPDAIKSLTDGMQSLSGISLDVEAGIKEIRGQLDEEEKKDKEFQLIYSGGSGNALKSSSILGELNSECAKCQEGLAKASQSNEELHRVMEIHIANLRILASPLHELQDLLPAIADIQRTPEDEATIKEMKRLYEKVEEMKAQRVRLEQQLRDELLKDDITAALVTQGDKNQEDFFQEQLGKHSKTVGFVEQNIAAQSNILRAFTDVNARFARIRKENTNLTNKRDAQVKDLIKSYDVYEDLLTKTNRGVQFYGKLDSSVKRLLEKTSNACKACQEERNTILERLAPKAPTPARPTAPKPGQPGVSNFNPAMSDLPGLPSAFYQPVAAPAIAQSAEPQPLRLKDFLPLMKPGSFGPKAPLNAPTSSGSEGVPLPTGSLPGSISASPVHFNPIGGSLPASPHKQLQQNAIPEGNQRIETFKQSVLPDSGVNEIGNFQIQANSSVAGYNQYVASMRSGVHANYNVPNSAMTTDVNLQPPSSSNVSASSSGMTMVSSTFASATQHPNQIESRGMNPLDGTGKNPVGTNSGVNHQMSSASQGFQGANTGHHSWSQVPSHSIGGPTLSSSSSNSLHGPVSIASQSMYPVNQQYLPNQSNTASTVAVFGYYGNQHISSSVAGALPPPFDVTASGTFSGASMHQPLPSFVGQSGHVVSGGFTGQSVHQLHYSQSMVSSAPIPSVGLPRHPVPQTGPQFNQVGYVPAESTVPISSVGMPRHPVPQTGPQFNQASYVPAESYTRPGEYAPVPVQPIVDSFHVNNQLRPSGNQWAPNQAPVPVANSLTGTPQVWDSSRNHQVSTQSHERLAHVPNMMSAGAGQRQPTIGSAQTRQHPQGYSSTFSGMPNYSSQQQGLVCATDNQSAQRYPVPIQQPGYQVQGRAMPPGYMENVNQPRYPDVSLQQQQTVSHMQSQPMHSYQQQPVAGHRQLAPQASNMPPVSSVPQLSSQANIRFSSGTRSQAGYPKPSLQQQPGFPTPSPQQQQPGYPTPSPQQQPGYPTPSQQQQPGYPTPPPQPFEGQSSQSYQMGNHLSGQQQYGYQTQNQSTRPVQQGYPVGGQQPVGYLTGNPAQPSSHLNSGYSYQGGVSGQVPVNFNQMASPQRFSAPNQQQVVAQNVPPAYRPQVTSSVTDNPPPSLPSPLQPSRVASSESQSSRNIDSLKDLEFSATGVSASGTVSASTGGQSQSVDRKRDSAGSSTFDGSSVEKSAVAPLLPKVVSTDEQREQREEEVRRTLQQSRSTHDPYSDSDVLGRFAAEVEKFQKLVDALVKPTLGGYLPLDKEWKDLNDEQEKSSKQCMAIARCYPLKNRFADVMPFDNSRVVLTGAADDYINASHLGSLSRSSPNFIATQSPLPTTFSDFWQMVHDQGTETVVALCVEQEAGMKNHIYWPTDKSQHVTHGNFVISLRSVKDKQMWIERILSVTHKATNQSRSIVHLQFVSWPPAGIPEAIENLIQFVVEVGSFYVQQRSLTKPVIVHCSNGVGRTGAFCLIYAAINEIDQGNGILQITEVVSRMRLQRKSTIQNKEQLKFCYDAILYYAQDLLRRRGLLSSRSSFSGGKLPLTSDRTHVRAPSDDLVLGLPSLSAIQSSVSRMSVRSPSTRVTSTDSTASTYSTDAPNVDMASKSESSMLSSSESIIVSPIDANIRKQFDEQNRASSPSLSTYSESGSSVNMSPQHSSVPSFSDPMHVSSADVQLLSSLPLSLADLQNPATFRIDPSPSSRRKVTKASFYSSTRPALGEGTDSSDPLSQLDPLWSLKTTS